MKSGAGWEGGEGQNKTGWNIYDIIVCNWRILIGELEIWGWGGKGQDMIRYDKTGWNETKQNEMGLNV